MKRCAYRCPATFGLVAAVFLLAATACVPRPGPSPTVALSPVVPIATAPPALPVPSPRPTTELAEWSRVALPEDGLSIEVPTSWERAGGEWAWSSPGTSPSRFGVAWAYVAAGANPLSLLPSNASVLGQAAIDLGWAQGTRYDVAFAEPPAARGGDRGRAAHVLVLIGPRACDFSMSAASQDQLETARVALDHVLASADLAGGTAFADQPLSRENAIWDTVAERTGGTIDPILRPSLLPTGLVGVRVLGADRDSFQIAYRGPGRSLTLGVAAFNPPLVDVRGSQQQITMRGQPATLQIEDISAPSRRVWLWWQEPGLWELPSREAAASIFYLVSAEEVSPDVVLDVSSRLVPPPPAPTSAPLPIPAPRVTPRLTATPTIPAGVDTVRVALIAIGGGTVGCGDGVVLVERKISPTRAPLTAAIQELLSIKDRSYGQSGLVNLLYQSDLQIESVTLVNGRASIRLRGQRMAGECDDPRVRAQLEATARQFATVKDVAIFLNAKPLADALSRR